MSRKSLIICLSALGGMLLIIGIAIFFLYSGMDSQSESDSVHGPAVLGAIPSDAALVAYGSVNGLCPWDDESLDAIKRHKMSISLHYSGKFHALYAIDVHKADKLEVDAVKQFLSSEGMLIVQEDDLLLASRSSNILKSSTRHLIENVSIKESPGFLDAFISVEGDNILLIPGSASKKLLSAAFTSSISSHSKFISSIADWYALRIDDDTPLCFNGTAYYEGETDEFMTVLQNCEPGESAVAEYLPSYTMSVFTLPLKNHEVFREAYSRFADSKGKWNSMLSKQNKLKKKHKISPEGFFRVLEVEEVATATMVIDNNLERINLIRIDNVDPEILFNDPDMTSMRGYVPVTHDWKYTSFTSSVYGDLFELKDESCFTVMDNWLVIGSRAAIDEYVTKDALSYTLEEYMSHADADDLLSDEPALAVAYYSLTAEKAHVKNYLKNSFREGLRDYIGEPQYCPAVLYISKNKDQMTISATVHSLSLSKTKAPSKERDTKVSVPEGPFKVVNSKTGMVNTFYQNKQKSLCLRNENGKDLWGIPFDKKICGTAQTVDFYNNGKLQILFGAGSQLYIVDVLGRYVKGYPIDLKKEILIGPELYDFEDNGKYSLMVLHSDNTIEKYGINGKKASSWKTISVKDETIKSLPTLLTVNGKRYWIVRTSIQTLIYPHKGGDPITRFEADAKIRPDSEIKTIEGENAVEVDCYDGRRRTIKL